VGFARHNYDDISQYVATPANLEIMRRSTVFVRYTEGMESSIFYFDGTSMFTNEQTNALMAYLIKTFGEVCEEENNSPSISVTLLDNLMDFIVDIFMEKMEQSTIRS
jgi:hypothetical protein